MKSHLNLDQTETMCPPPEKPWKIPRRRSQKRPREEQRDQAEAVLHQEMDWEISGVYKMRSRSPCRSINWITRMWITTSKKRKRNGEPIEDKGSREVCECILRNTKHCKEVEK